MSTLYGFYTPHERVIFDCGDELITKQSMKDECDINTILSQFSKTGILSHVNNSTASFLDLPDNLDFQQSLAIVQEAEFAFSTLPSKVRERYQNDPSLFLSALSDPAQRAFLEEVGVFKPAPVAASDTPTPASPAATGVGVNGG